MGTAMKVRCKRCEKELQPVWKGDALFVECPDCRPSTPDSKSHNGAAIKVLHKIDCPNCGSEGLYYLNHDGELAYYCIGCQKKEERQAAQKHTWVWVTVVSIPSIASLLWLLG